MLDELVFDATIDNIEAVTSFVNEHLEAMGFPMKAQMQIDIAIDELFGNICHYAYGSGTGTAKVRVEQLASEGSVRITFEDEGLPFNPLEHKDPDVTLGIEERGIGGLGIFMVKKIMDDVQYVRRGATNVLSIVKAL